jgi:hypothetical protein
MWLNEFDPAAHGVTQGLIGNFIDCRERTRLWLQGWELPGGRLALRFGDAGHKCLEDLYAYYSQNKAPRKMASLIEEVQLLTDQTVTAWGERERAKTTDPSAIEDTEYIEPVMVALMPEYARFYKKDFAGKKWVGLEQEFAVDFHDAILRGKRDGVFKLKGALWVLESKTKSQIVEATLNDTLAFDLQNLFYLLATKLETKKRVAGVLYNIIRRPGLRQGAKESFEAFCTRVTEDIAKRPEWYFKRFELAYPKPEIDRFTDETKYKLDDLRAWLGGDAPTYRNERACTTQYGRCDYLKACAQGNTAGYIKREKLYPELEHDEEE